VEKGGMYIYIAKHPLCRLSNVEATIQMIGDLAKRKGWGW